MSKHKLGEDLASRRFMDDLRRKYEDSMATLRPLLAQIEETDRQVDLVVYRRYDLADAEITMVEEAAG
ncbi:MAG: hypothetical protein U9N48_01515 [Euryarchaeota archaeon]|nr:hypothetical protein [Euryarchaeota archaeon]